MKKKRILKLIFTAITIIITLLFLQDLAVKPWGSNDERIAGFYMEPENSLDVVLIGSSEIFHAFSSCQAYAEYGFLSYPFACAQNSVASWKDQTDEIMRTQKPELIVVEINGTLYRDEPIYIENDLRLFTNNMPRNENMKELLDSYSEHYMQEDRISYYLPYLKYHTNIFPLSKAIYRITDKADLKSRGFTYLKGTMVNFYAMKPKELAVISDTETTSELEPDYEEVLREYLQYCCKMDYPLLFVRAPHCIQAKDDKNIDRFHMANRVAEIVGEYGYDFIHFDKIHDKIGIEEEEDFESAEHLNIYGQQKFTRFFSEYLLEHYISGKREKSETVKREWELCRRYYEQYMKDAYRYRDADDDNEDGMFARESAVLIKRLTQELKEEGAI